MCTRVEHDIIVVELFPYTQHFCRTMYQREPPMCLSATTTNYVLRVCRIIPESCLLFFSLTVFQCLNATQHMRATKWMNARKLKTLRFSMWSYRSVCVWYLPAKDEKYTDRSKYCFAVNSNKIKHRAVKAAFITIAYLERNSIRSVFLIIFGCL